MKTLTQVGLAVAAALVCTLNPARAQTGHVTLYGVIDMAVESADTGAARIHRVESGVIAGSRWGVRGHEDLGGGQRALYVLEAGFNADSGIAGQGGLAFGRQAFVGLAGPWGQFTAGRHYTTFHTSLATYALTGLIWGNAANYFRDGSVLRANNALRYLTPAIGDFTARAMYSFGEALGTSEGSLYGGSIDYVRGPWTGGLSWLERKTTATNTDRYLALGAAYDMGFARTALLYSTRSDSLASATSNDGRFYELSATIPVGQAGQVLLSYGAYRGRARPQTDAKALSVRYDHSLSKRTRLYTGVARIDNDAKAAFAINTASNSGPAGPAGGSPRSVVVGLSHSF